MNKFYIPVVNILKTEKKNSRYFIPALNTFVSTSILAIFFFMPLSISAGDDYTTAPLKNIENLNRVTPMDMIIIQKHLLGIDLIISPYRLLAADVNNSGSVTALDLIEVRRLILGEIEEFGQVDSLVSIDRNNVVSEPTNQWYESRPQTITLGDLSGCE